MAKLNKYKVVGMELITAKKDGKQYIKLHLTRQVGDNTYVNTLFLSSVKNCYQIGDELEVIEYAGKIELVE